MPEPRPFIITLLKTILIILFTLSSLLFFHNINREKRIISEACGLDVSSSTVQESSETHGGFLGDGETFIVLSFADGSCLEAIQSKPGWKKLPLNRRIETLLSGNRISDDEGKPRFPTVKNGYYYFYDKQNYPDNPYDDTNLFSRYSYNIIIAVYDADSNKLYYCEFDT